MTPIDLRVKGLQDKIDELAEGNAQLQDKVDEVCLHNARLRELVKQVNGLAPISHRFRVEQIGSGFAVQEFSAGEYRSEDLWNAIGKWNNANKCVVFTKEEADVIAAAFIARVEQK